MFVVATFYKFVTLFDYRAMRAPLLVFCNAWEVRGSILLAEEGINATVAGTRQAVDALLAELRRDARLHDLEYKESYVGYLPFDRMKVRLKREIVTLKMPGVDPNQQVGTYIEPQAWNDLISDPEVMVIDVRNDFEVNLGSFEGAWNPQTESFGDFPAFVQHNLDPQRHKKIAMFCTGGIRCEKATSYLLSQGFEAVYHLKGGILRYLEMISPSESLWEGECFVFDQRVSVNHRLQPGTARICERCQQVVKAGESCGCG